MTNHATPATTSEGLAGGADPRAALASAGQLATATIAAITPEVYDRPTPCAGSSVHDLLGHLLMVVERIGCAGRGAAPSTWPTEPRFVGNDDWQAAWENAMDIACAAWADDTTLARATELPWATVPGALVVAIYTSEITVHTWDLAVATGQHPRFADDVVATSLAAMHDQLPVADRGAMWEAMLAALPPEAPREVPFANAVALDAGAPLIDQLVAWTGRDPALLGPGA